MEGASLLSGGPEDDRLIFSTGAAYLKDNAGLLGLDIERIRPPFYQFGYLGIVNCQIWYRYNLVEDIWESGLVHGYTSDCEGDKLLTPEQIKNALINHMKSNGFDTSSLENKIITPAPVPVP
jgi:hypothetical protein